jgi:methionine synthase II (cobalamin-independent)
VLGELPHLPHVPELPARGPGADLTGRTLGLLPGIHADVQPSGWRLTPRPSLDWRRAGALLTTDLDALEAAGALHDGLLKTQVCGPWTLAATVELHRGDRALADRGAVRDLAAALAEAVAAHVADLRRRLPRATVVVQLDEPALPAVRAGRVPTASGFGRLRAVDDATVTAALSAVVAAAGAPVGLHCCAADVPFDLATGAGLAFVSADATQFGRRDYDQLGTFVDGGGLLMLGVVPGTDPPRESGPPPRPSEVAAPARTLWRELSFPAETLPERVVLTPACGLAGASPAWARTALARLRDAARSLAERPEETGG